MCVSLLAGASAATASGGGRGAQTAIVTVHAAKQPRGVIATSGGWAYCQQVRALARRFRYTLVCGRYFRDGYTSRTLRSRRLLDWGDPDYLAALAARIEQVHRRVGGELVLLGVSYSGFGVATLVSHHPELRPDRLIVIDSFLDLTARRAAATSSNDTGAEIDAATGGSAAALASQSVSVDGLAQVLRTGTELTAVWSISDDERHEFHGATCGPNASAGVLAQVATALGRPVTAWVTLSKHGHDLWDSGRRIVAGHPPGRQVTFEPGQGTPPGSTC